MRPYLEVDPDLNVDAWYPSMLQVCSTVALGDQAAGEMHCQGMSADVNTFFYNIPMLEAAGLELPGPGFTWDDMAEYARVPQHRRRGSATPRRPTTRTTPTGLSGPSAGTTSTKRTR